MSKLPSFHGLIARIPIRQRLALVSFGLLALLLAVLGMFISITEEQSLLASQANVLSNEMRITQLQLQATKISFTESQILTFPLMSKKTALSLVRTVHTLLDRDVGISFLSFDGSLLATDNSHDPSTIEKFPDSQN